MSDLKPCPCGKVPETLGIECEPRAKYGNVACPCGDWTTEFRAQYTAGDERYKRAVAAWNDAPRADLGISKGLRERVRDMTEDYGEQFGWEAYGVGSWAYSADVLLRDILAEIGGGDE